MSILYNTVIDTDFAENLDVSFYYYPASEGTEWEPPDYEDIEIISVLQEGNETISYWDSYEWLEINAEVWKKIREQVLESKNFI